mmetsp:Transcript_15389/g.45332  ORF Transcript_15389/g.45332 Transcript_15389/m.45332 type:complete len:226 (+) Transcript_15389:332-1009(+)
MRCSAGDGHFTTFLKQASLTKTRKHAHDWFQQYVTATCLKPQLNYLSGAKSAEIRNNVTGMDQALAVLRIALLAASARARNCGNAPTRDVSKKPMPRYPMYTAPKGMPSTTPSSSTRHTTASAVSTASHTARRARGAASSIATSTVAAAVYEHVSATFAGTLLIVGSFPDAAASLANAAPAARSDATRSTQLDMSAHAVPGRGAGAGDVGLGSELEGRRTGNWQL